jgi:drug/metabolite transporter (DMT)-like permease
MSSSWFYLALGSTIISALVNLLDSHYMTQRMPGWRAYILLCDVLTIPAGIIMLAVFPVPSGIGSAPLISAAAATVTSSLATVLILEVMKSEHISRVSPIISLSPVLVGLLAFMFLGETFHWQQVLGIAGVVLGAIFISFRWEGGTAHFHKRAVLTLLAAAVLVAVSNIFNKYALESLSFWTDAALVFLISSVLFIFVCVRRSVLLEIRDLKDRTFTVSIAFLNQIVAMVAMLMAYWGLKIGPVALNSAVFNSKPLFVFVFSTIVGHAFPKFLPPESVSRRSLLIKAGATLAIVGGLAVMLI